MAERWFHLSTESYASHDDEEETFRWKNLNRFNLIWWRFSVHLTFWDPWKTGRGTSGLLPEMIWPVEAGIMVSNQDLCLFLLSSSHSGFWWSSRFQGGSKLQMPASKSAEDLKSLFSKSTVCDCRNTHGHCSFSTTHTHRLLLLFITFYLIYSSPDWSPLILFSLPSPCQILIPVVPPSLDLNSSHLWLISSRRQISSSIASYHLNSLLISG